MQVQKEGVSCECEADGSDRSGAAGSGLAARCASRPPLASCPAEHLGSDKAN